MPLEQNKEYVCLYRVPGKMGFLIEDRIKGKDVDIIGREKPTFIFTVTQWRDAEKRARRVKV
jgi:hypothetical protein